MYFWPHIDKAKGQSVFLKTYFGQLNGKNDEAIIFGKHIITKRKAAWYGDVAFEYTYSKITKKALPWTKELLNLKSLVEEQSQETYNSCLLNLYHDGNEGMAWHSDGEKDLKKKWRNCFNEFWRRKKICFQT